MTPNHVALTAFTQQQLNRRDTQQYANQHLNEHSTHICQRTFIEKPVVAVLSVKHVGRF